MFSSRTSHLLHCLLLLCTLLTLEILAGAVKWSPVDEDQAQQDVNPWEVYGVFPTLLLYLLRLLTFLALPQVIFNILGLTLFNTFPEKVVLKGSPLLAPFLCIRVVTRGDFPDLVKKNVTKNLNLCIDVGLENFIVEVVTDRLIPGLSSFNRVREVVVPLLMQPKVGPCSRPELSSIVSRKMSIFCQMLTGLSIWMKKHYSLKIRFVESSTSCWTGSISLDRGLLPMQTIKWVKFLLSHAELTRPTQNTVHYEVSMSPLIFRSLMSNVLMYCLIIL